MIVGVRAQCAETLTIRDVPARLPRDTSLGAYSPLVAFEYAGLRDGETYVLRVWLLAPGSWHCASSQWCERQIPIDNLSGTNTAGSVLLAQSMDVYDYARFDWVLRLYNRTGREVAFTERYTNATGNRPPVLDPIGSRSAVVGQMLEFVVTASDPEGSAVHLAASGLPSNAQFDPSTGRFSWIPVSAGTHTGLIFAATDTGEGPLTDAEIVEINVSGAPAIVAHPQDRVVPEGADAVFSVEARSDTAIRYQWRRNGVPLPGAIDATLQLNSVTAERAGAYSVVVSNMAGSQASADAILTVVRPRTSEESAGLSLAHLRRVMDEFHNRIPVYDDISSPGNRFHARGLVPDESAPVTTDGSWTDNPHSGATCTRFIYTRTGDNWGGVYFLNGILLGPDAPPPLLPNAPAPYFGEAVIPRTGIAVTSPTGLDLSGATALTFWARGEIGGETIEFFMGGVGRHPVTGSPTQPYPDSTPRTPSIGTTFTLGTNWRKFTIPLTGANLTNVMGGFGWAANAPNNPNGAVFYVDDVQYELSATGLDQRLNEPRFLRSFLTRAVQPSLSDGNPDDDLDLVLRNNAFIYDNALAILAFIADGSPDSLRRARSIGDAMVYASQHDRTYDDGRLRTAYMAGDIALPPGWAPNGQRATVPVPGFYREDGQTFLEVENRDLDTGNNAWAMLALVALYERVGGPEYLAAAERIGRFIRTFRDDTGPLQGFRGGIYNAETALSSPRAYASTEHNLDIIGAFTRMHRVTGEAYWLEGAEHARAFVEAMWDSSRGCYLTGTRETEPETRNDTPGQLPLDAQSWTVLARPDALTLHPLLLARADENHRNSADGFSGYDFNEDRDGVWLEGTAQMSVAYQVAQRPSDAGALLETLQAAQQLPVPIGDGGGLVAASHDGVSSGFGFKWFRRLHVAATAWNVMAQLGFNPYYDTSPGSPSIIRPPESGVAQAGDAVTFSLLATSTRPLAYQWRLNGEDVMGATSASFTIACVQRFHAGGYTVVVTGQNGESIATDAASLAVTAPAANDSRLLNLSTRALCLTGDDVLIPGFVIDGSGTKQLLIRTVGPTLGVDPFNIVGVLPNPQLTLKRMVGGTYQDIGSNDDWGSNANADEIRQAAARVWAFGLIEGSADAALLVDLTPGQYTVVASDVGPNTGIAIVEFYDADEVRGAAKLVNLSNRGYVGIGDRIMIPGIIVSDEGSKTLLVRAVGPGLAPFGVGGLLADPQVTIFRGSDRLLENDNWGVGADATQTAAVAGQVFAFPLAAGSEDAAFVVTLPPGAYTVQASGVGDTTGVALVEVYLVP